MLLALNSDELARICSFLSPDDIVALAMVCKQLYEALDATHIYHLMYLKKFGMNSAVLDNYNWKEIFQLRCSLSNQLYTWGSAQLGRLGYLVKSIPQENVNRAGMNSGVHYATKLKNFDSFLITALSSNGFSFQILTNDGNLYITGADFRKAPPEPTAPGPRDAEDETGGRLVSGARYNTQPFAPVTSMHIETNRNLRRPPEQLVTDPPTSGFFDFTGVAGDSSSTEKKSKRPEVEETSFVTKCKLPTPARIISISSGRQHFIALDDDNNIYTWDTGLPYRSFTGIRVEFPDLPIQNPVVTKIKCGWSTSSCYIKDLGVVVWYARERVLYGAESARVFCWLIPDKKGEIVDYHLGNDFILIIKKDKGLFGMSVDTMHYYHGTGTATQVLNDFFPLVTFNDWLRKYNEEHGTAHEFSKLNGCYNSFVVFTTESALFGDKKMVQSFDDAENVEELQPKLYEMPPNVIDVEMGDYHYLALTADGELYSWGHESDSCGCLGLGPRQGAQSKPALVRKPVGGKWIAITASGWHSGGILVPDGA